MSPVNFFIIRTNSTSFLLWYMTALIHNLLCCCYVRKLDCFLTVILAYNDGMYCLRVLRRLTTKAPSVRAVVVSTSETISPLNVLIPVSIVLFVPAPTHVAVSLLLLLSLFVRSITLVELLLVRPDNVPVTAGPGFLRSTICGSTGLILSLHLIALLYSALSLTSSGVKWANDMALFTLQGKLRALLDSIHDAANVVQIHWMKLYPLPRDPTATVVFIVVVYNSSKFEDTSACCCSSKVGANSLLACVSWTAVPATTCSIDRGFAATSA